MAVEMGVVQREIRVGARPETVFEFFTDPAKMVRWMGLTAALDPRPRQEQTACEGHDREEGAEDQEATRAPQHAGQG